MAKAPSGNPVVPSSPPAQPLELKDLERVLSLAAKHARAAADAVGGEFEVNLGLGLSDDLQIDGHKRLNICITSNPAKTTAMVGRGEA